jgi:mRNA interferase MazF
VKRGDIFSVSAPGDYGKPRPAVILQTDALNDVNFASVLVCPMTSHLVEAPLFRLNLKPSKANGLRKESQLMVDKVQAISRIGKLMGKVDSKTMKKVNQAIAFVMGLGE